MSQERLTKRNSTQEMGENPNHFTYMVLIKDLVAAALYLANGYGSLSYI